MGLGGRAIVCLAAVAVGQDGTETPRRRSQGKKTAAPGWGRWLGEPRAAVLIVMLLIVLIGGGRKLLQGYRARRAVNRLGEPDVSAGEVEAAVEFGREGLMDLFRPLGPAGAAQVRPPPGPPP